MTVCSLILRLRLRVYLIVSKPTELNTNVLNLILNIIEINITSIILKVKYINEFIRA